MDSKSFSTNSLLNTTSALLAFIETMSKTIFTKIKMDSSKDELKISKSGEIFYIVPEEFELFTK
jgi:hypothetical protein